MILHLHIIPVLKLEHIHIMMFSLVRSPMYIMAQIHRGILKALIAGPKALGLLNVLYKQIQQLQLLCLRNMVTNISHGVDIDDVVLRDYHK